MNFFSKKKGQKLELQWVVYTSEFDWIFCCREICFMDASTVVRIRTQFSNPKVSASTEESPSHYIYIGCGTGDTYIFQLVANIASWVGLNWSGNHFEYIMVAHCSCSIGLHFLYQVRWCLGRILMASICRLVGLCEAFIGFCCNVMVCYSPPFYVVSHTTLADTEFVL